MRVGNLLRAEDLPLHRTLVLALADQGRDPILFGLERFGLAEEFATAQIETAKSGEIDRSATGGKARFGLIKIFAEDI